MQRSRNSDWQQAQRQKKQGGERVESREVNGVQEPNDPTSICHAEFIQPRVAQRNAYRVRVTDDRALYSGLRDLNPVEGAAVAVEEYAHAILQQTPT